MLTIADEFENLIVQARSQIQLNYWLKERYIDRIKLISLLLHYFTTAACDLSCIFDDYTFVFSDELFWKRKYTHFYLYITETISILPWVAAEDDWNRQQTIVFHLDISVKYSIVDSITLIVCLMIHLQVKYIYLKVCSLSKIISRWILSNLIEIVF